MLHVTGICVLYVQVFNTCAFGCFMFRFHIMPTFALLTLSFFTVSWFTVKNKLSKVKWNYFFVGNSSNDDVHSGIILSFDVLLLLKSTEILQSLFIYHCVLCAI